MRKIYCLLFLFILLRYVGFSQQGTNNEHFFQKIYINYHFLPIPKDFISRDARYDHFVTGIDIYIKISDNWYGGISSYHLWLVWEGNRLFYYTQPFFITSIFTRHYFSDYPIKPYWEASIGAGNLCPCPIRIPGFFLADGLYRTDKPAYHFGAGLGFDIKFTNGMIIRPNIKTFYLLNNIDGKRLHFRPSLSFQFAKRYRQPPVIFSPRF